MIKNLFCICKAEIDKVRASVNVTQSLHSLRMNNQTTLPNKVEMDKLRSHTKGKLVQRQRKNAQA